MKEKVIISAACLIYKEDKKDTLWFLIKNQNSEWEIPKTSARRGESSVRAGLRLMQDQATFKVRVLEEVGRSSGAIKVGNSPVTQKTLFYLMIFESGGEVIGFEESDWLKLSKAIKKIKSKKEAQMLKKAQELKKELDKEREKNKKILDIDF